MFVTTISKEDGERLKKGLIEQSFSFSHPPYTHFQAKKTGITCTLYTSLKLTVQGKQMDEFIEFYLEPEILKSPLYTCKKELAIANLDLRPRIGVDESGKGDYFGPLCISGVFADEHICTQLISLGVCDSKLLSDKQIQKLAPQITAIAPNYTIRLQPKKYNELYHSFKNLNSLLAWCHTSVIEQLSRQCAAQVAIIDQFAAKHEVERAARKKGLSLPIEQRVRGEQDVVVAAASILARSAFIQGMLTLEETFQCTLPKGASSAVIAAAKTAVHKLGAEALGSIAKLHFKTTQEVLSI